jgi:hypothetical protein
MAQTAKSTSLLDQALAAEHIRHTERLLAINHMQADLHALQAHMPALQAQGLSLDIAHSYPARHNGRHCIHLCGDYWGDSGCVFKALLQLGFEEQHSERVTYGSFVSVLLSDGKLRLQLHVTNAVAQSNPVPPTPARRASDAPALGVATAAAAPRHPLWAGA